VYLLAQEISRRNVGFDIDRRAFIATDGDWSQEFENVELVLPIRILTRGRFEIVFRFPCHAFRQPKVINFSFKHAGRNGNKGCPLAKSSYCGKAEDQYGINDNKRANTEVVGLLGMKRGLTVATSNAEASRYGS